MEVSFCIYITWLVRSHTPRKLHLRKPILFASWWISRGYIHDLLSRRVWITSHIFHSLKIRSKLRWNIKSKNNIGRENFFERVFGGESRTVLWCSTMLVRQNSKTKSCHDIRYTEPSGNSALPRDDSCLGTWNPSEKLVFEIKDGYKVASVNSRYRGRVNLNHSRRDKAKHENLFPGDS